MHTTTFSPEQIPHPLQRIKPGHFAESQNLTSKFEHNPAKKRRQHFHLGNHIKSCSLRIVLVCFEEIISAQNLPGLTHELQILWHRRLEAGTHTWDVDRILILLFAKVLSKQSKYYRGCPAWFAL